MPLPESPKPRWGLAALLATALHAAALLPLLLAPGEQPQPTVVDGIDVGPAMEGSATEEAAEDSVAESVTDSAPVPEQQATEAPPDEVAKPATAPQETLEATTPPPDRVETPPPERVDTPPPELVRPPPPDRVLAEAPPPLEPVPQPPVEQAVAPEPETRRAETPPPEAVPTEEPEELAEAPPEEIVTAAAPPPPPLPPPPPPVRARAAPGPVQPARAAPRSAPVADASAPAATATATATQHAPAQRRPPASYISALLAALERHKDYPITARERHAQGTALLQFAIHRDGTVASWRIQRSSGHQDLDEAVGRMVQRASPLPPPPSEIPGDPVVLVVPVRFALR